MDEESFISDLKAALEKDLLQQYPEPESQIDKNENACYNTLAKAIRYSKA